MSRRPVLGLLLTPDDLGLLEARKLLDQRLERKRVELLDPQQVDVVDAALLALVVEVIIDLARAQDDAANLSVLDELDLLALMRLQWSHKSRWKLVPGAKALSADTARLLRSIDFGVITISGLRNSRLSWRRSAWKKLAGVVQLTICMLSSPQSCRKRWSPAPTSAPAPVPHIRAAGSTRGPTCAAISARRPRRTGRTPPARHWRNRRTAPPT